MTSARDLPYTALPGCSTPGPARVLAVGLLSMLFSTPLPACAEGPEGESERTALEQALGAARAHHGAGRQEEALAAYREVAEAAEATAPSLAAIAYNNRCLLLFERTEYRAARTDCERALELRRGLGDEQRLARTLNNLGLVLQYLGRYREAGERFGEALGLNRLRGDVSAVVLNHANLGNLALTVGDYEEALRHLARAESLAQKHRDEPWGREQIRVARLNRGAVFEKLGAYREGLRLYREMAAEREAMDPVRWATLRVNMGVLYRNLGDPVTAVTAFEEALAVFRQRGQQALESNALLNLALARHRNLGQPEAAEEHYRQALELARGSGDRTEEMQDLFYLGQLLLEQGRLSEAEMYFTRGLDVSEAAGSAEGRWSTLRGLGEIDLAQGEPEEALDHLLQAIEEIERVRASLRRPGRRAGYFGDKRPVYGAAVIALAELERRSPDQGHAEHALELVQRAKARELQEALSPSPGVAPLSTEELRTRTGKGRVLELFRAGETGPTRRGDRLFAWTFDRSGLAMHDLGPSEPLLAAVHEVHRSLRAGREPPPGGVQRLSRALLGKTDLLAGDPRILRIAPDGGFFYLPFELLEDPTSGRLLVERTTLSYLPTASLLPASGDGPRHRSSRAGSRFLGLGDPVLQEEVDAPAAEPATTVDLLASRFRLQPLPAAARELRAIARRFPGEALVRTGDQATEQILRREASQGARVVHLATHTLMDERLGTGGAVVLTPSEKDDGLLTPDEIAGMDFRVDLTVLASCRSALGSAADGQALASLTGSLLAAGSSGVIATLWDVEDEATAVFMSQLYHGLSRGLPPAEALRATKLRLRTHPAWGRPHLWAGYVLIGHAEPMTDPPFLGRWGWAIMAGLSAALIMALWERRRRRPSDPAGSVLQRPTWF